MKSETVIEEKAPQPCGQGEIHAAALRRNSTEETRAAHGLDGLLGRWGEVRQVWPNFPKVVWAEFFTSNGASGILFNRVRKCRGASFHPIHDVLEVPFCRVACGSECVSLFRTHWCKECFQGHSAHITPFGVFLVNTSWFYYPDLLAP